MDDAVSLFAAVHETLVGPQPTSRDIRLLVASLIGHLGSSTFRLSTGACRCCSRARASLRNRHQGPSIMGFEDEAEQSIGRPCRQTKRRIQATKRTHLIHRPARDIMPPRGGARVSSYSL